MAKKRIGQRVADVLRKYGWIQGYMSSPKGFCLFGACRHLRYQNELTDDSFNRLILRLEKTVGSSVTAWNDNKERKLEDVIDLLENL